MEISVLSGMLEREVVVVVSTADDSAEGNIKKGVILRMINCNQPVSGFYLPFPLDRNLLICMCILVPVPTELLFACFTYMSLFRY